MSDYSQDEITLYNNYLSSYKHKEIFSSSDIYVVPIFLLLIFLFLRYKKTKQPLEIQHFFLLGYYIRIIGLILFVVFHKYLYSGGVDSFSYYWSGNNIYHFAKIDFIKAIKFIFYPNGTFNEYDFPVTLNPFVYTENESLITKVSALGNMFCNESYLTISMLLSVFAFGGSWRTYKIFFRLFPDEKKTLAICFLFIPSTFFWTSGLTKEVICMGALGYIFFAFFDLFINKKNIFWNFITIIFMSYLIINTKIYILIAFIPSIILLITLILIKNIKSRFIKIFIAPLFLITIIFYLVNFYSNSTSLSNRFSSEMILEYAKVSYEYLSQTDLAESTYDLGKFEPTLNGIMRLAPSGINVTLFRPYFWEAKKPIVILASIESTLFLLLTLFVVFKIGIFKIFKLIFSNPIILFCIIFALIFSLAVGLTSGNFGTLMRYKIPMLQFYATALLLIYKKKEYPFSKSIT